MRSGPSLVVRIWAAVSGVSIFAVVSVSLVVRAAFNNAFGFYLSHQGIIGPSPRGPGLLVLGATEQEFQTSVDQGIFWSALAAILVAFVVAYLLARAVARPLERLTQGAQAVAAGDLEYRVDIKGPPEVERLSLAFNEMASSLSEAEDLRRRLVADVAHELRNPVAALRAQVEGIAEGVLEPDVARLESLVADAGHLSRLVDDLQELSVADAGKLGYDMAELDLRDIVKVETERAASNARGAVEVTSSCGIDRASVTADERRIGQVLRNLLSNALRHTTAGSISVVCAVDSDRVTVTVRDTGEGVPEEDLPHIFERFYRADAARAKDTGGVGVGLAVARRIVQDHGGDVFALSTLGQGSEIGFWLTRSESAG